MQSCSELSLPALLLVRVVSAAASQEERSSGGLVRKSGRWVGKLTRRKGGIGRWWREHDEACTAIERQIDIAIRFALA